MSDEKGRSTLITLDIRGRRRAPASSAAALVLLMGCPAARAAGIDAVMKTLYETKLRMKAQDKVTFQRRAMEKIQDTKRVHAMIARSVERGTAFAWEVLEHKMNRVGLTALAVHPQVTMPAHRDPAWARYAAQYATAIGVPVRHFLASCRERGGPPLSIAVSAQPPGRNSATEVPFQRKGTMTAATYGSATFTDRNVLWHAMQPTPIFSQFVQSKMAGNPGSFESFQPR